MTADTVEHLLLDPAPPFVWPNLVLAEIAAYRFPVPFQSVIASGSCVLGIVSAIDHRGAEWLKTVLHQCPDLQAVIILAVFGGCATRRRDLEALLEVQEQSKSRLQFRLLPMAADRGAPVNCMAVLPRPETGTAPVLLVGPSPNFGLDGVDQTQVNLVFLVDAALFDGWRRWFDWTWLRSAGLTASTADIPALVPTTGSPAAAAKWEAYCAICAGDANSRSGVGAATDPETKEVKPQTHADRTVDQSSVAGRRGASAAIDTETREVKPKTKLDGTVDQPPTAMLDLPKLDRLAERISRIVTNGRQVTIAYSSAVRPVDAPVNPGTFGQQSEHRDGSIVQRQSFRVSVFDESELREINDFRRGSQTIIEKLGLPLEKGLYWIPNPMIMILEAEIQAMNQKAGQKLTGLVGDDIADFVKSKTDKIRQDLSVVYRRLGGQGDVPQNAVTELVNDLTRRIERAIGDRFVTPVSLSEIRFSLSSEKGIQVPWAQAAKLSLALARFPRVVARRPKTLAGLQTAETDIVSAMNVADDIFAKILRDRSFESRARSELQLLDRIAAASTTDRDRCEASFMLMNDVLPRDIDRFIACKESVR